MHDARVTMGTIVELLDVKDRPRARMSLPGPLRVGDRIKIRLRLQRRKDGRTFQLDLDDEVRVTSVSFDATRSPALQVLAVECIGAVPAWKAVRNPPTRVLPPTRFPPTKV